MMGLVEIVTDPQFLITVVIGLATFATVFSLAAPLIEGDRLAGRMKTMAKERARLRALQRQKMELAQGRGRLRQTSKGFMKDVVDQFNLATMFDVEEIRAKMRMAGLRGPRPIVAYLFFRLAMPIIMFIGAVAYLFVINNLDHSVLFKLLIAVGAAYVGYYVPNIFIQNLIQRRQKSIKRAFPDSLDLLLICVEAGMSIEAAFNKVAGEIGSQSIEMAEEMALTTAELSYLPERRQAYENLARRTALEGVHAVTTSLIQAERYGTPLAQSLRVMAQENRDMRMSDAEKKAAALPPKLTVPMIVFFLPVLFVVILGPAAIKVMEL
jgi:tight adherence protein C